MSAPWTPPITPEEFDSFIKAGADYAQSDSCMDEEEARHFAGGVVEAYLSLGVPLLSADHARNAVKKALNTGRACM